MSSRLLTSNNYNHYAESLAAPAELFPVPALPLPVLPLPALVPLSLVPSPALPAVVFEVLLPVFLSGTGLTNIIPDNLRSLTVNIHALLSPVIDIIALGDAKARREFQKLRYLRVQMTFEDKCWPDSDPPPTPRSSSAHFTTYEPKEGRPDEVNLPLMEPRKRRQRQILYAFKGTGVDVHLDFFRRRMHSDIVEHHLTSPVDRVYTDARLVDKVE